LYCQNCGSQVAETVKFCTKCGTPVQNTQSVPYQQTQTVTQFQSRSGKRISNPGNPARHNSKKCEVHRVLFFKLGRFRLCAPRGYSPLFHWNRGHYRHPSYHCRTDFAIYWICSKKSALPILRSDGTRFRGSWGELSSLQAKNCDSREAVSQS